MTNSGKESADQDLWGKKYTFFYLGNFTVANYIGMYYNKSLFFIIVHY